MGRLSQPLLPLNVSTVQSALKFNSNECAQLFINPKEGVLIFCRDINGGDGLQFWFIEQYKGYTYYTEVTQIKVSSIPNTNPPKNTETIKVELQNLNKTINMNARYVNYLGTTIKDLSHLNSPNLKEKCKIQKRNNKPYLVCNANSNKYEQELRHIKDYYIPK